MHSTCFTSCNRCTNRLAIRPVDRLKHRSPVPARSPLVPQTGEVWRVGLACVLYTTPYACMCIVSLQPIESNFRRLCDFTPKCRKTLLSRRLINLEQAERRTLAYDRLTRPIVRLFEKHWGTSLVNPTVITVDRSKSSISTQWSSYAVTHRLNRNFAYSSKVVKPVYCWVISLLIPSCVLVLILPF